MPRCRLRCVAGPLLMAVALSLAGCGMDAGEWTDDARNWKRAFGQDPPAGIEVLRSHYWRSAHWTYEFEYFFVVRDTPQARALLFAGNRLQPYANPDDLAVGLSDHFGRKPDWFTPKPMDQYEVWIFKDPPRQHYRLYIDAASGEIHLTDYQV